MTDETGITNLGSVPEGMTFYQAILATRDQRKFHINAGHHSGRLTICEAMREIVRETQADAPDLAKIAELARAGFDFGKRQDRRLKELKGMLGCSA